MLNELTGLRMVLGFLFLFSLVDTSVSADSISVYIVVATSPEKMPAIDLAKRFNANVYVSKGGAYNVAVGPLSISTGGEAEFLAKEIKLRALPEDAFLSRGTGYNEVWHQPPFPVAKEQQPMRYPSFGSFHTGLLYQGALAKPVLLTNEARKYRSRLIAGAREKPNFASHYHIVTWGCGSSCATGAVIDAATGHIVFIPFSICCYAGAMDAPDWDSIQFRADSSLVVFHGQRNEEGVNGDHYYTFDGNEFRLVLSEEVGNAEDTLNRSAVRAPSQGVQACHEIEDAKARLKCYDAILQK